MNPSVLLAAVDWDKIFPPTGRKLPLSSTLREGLIVSGVAVAIVAVIVIWVVFLRKRKRDRAHRHHHHAEKTGGRVPVQPLTRRADGHELRGSSGRRKWRRRRRDHRPRNPTLAETGGLPPLRNGDAPPSPR